MKFRTYWHRICWHRLVAILALGIMCSTSVNALDIGDPAPSFRITTLAGDTVDLADSLGKRPIYLKFWATWCKYCIYELPHAQQVFNQYGDKVTVLLINVGMNDSADNIHKAYSKAKVSLPTAIDTNGEIVASYGVVGTPNHILIDATGRLLYRSFLASDELDAHLAALATNATKTEIQP